jgi:ribulose-5-phosphate 4-epimerase/fuculose-1-phosphate aldolase
MDTLEARLATRPGNISSEEWAVRVDLAACYRLIAHFGWDDLVLTHNSARVPGEPNHFLINPMGLMFNEITASNLLKMDLDGNLVEPSEYEANRAGYVIHSAIYLDLDERERLQQSIGDSPVLVLRNHGLLATGRNVAEAFSLTYHFERSAESQLKIMAAVAAGAKMVVPSRDTCERQAALFTGNEPRLQGQREWPALLRLCDRIDPSYRT